MNKTRQFKRTAFNLSAKSMVSLMLLLIAMLMPQGAWAISGSGTSASPYLIANEADLRTFQQYVENGNSGIYGKLTADITLTSAWTRIGRADRKFTGYFDGQGHTISGMNLSFTAYEHGFFGFVNNATIKNFTLTGTMTSSANGNHSHGTVVGSAAGTTVIENVTSSVNLTLNHTGFTCIGGIVGHMDESSKVIGCTYNGTIKLNKDSEQVGGIVGYAQRNLYITDNVFSGTITSTGTCKYLAGIAGKTDGTIEVSGCTNIGTINGGPSYDCVAGIVGYVQYQSRALITNCYFGGSLSSTSSGTSLVMGGILGAVNDDAGTNFRGLTYCFSDGTLTATNSSSTQIGGIAGVIKSKAVSKVMNNTYLSGTASRLAAISNNSSSFDSSNKAITISVTAGTGGEVSQSYVYPTSTTATQLKVEATPNSGYHYDKWSDNGAQTHNVSLTGNVSLTANFGAHTYGDWITDVAATCIKTGTKHRVCTHTGCDESEDATIAIGPHTFAANDAAQGVCTVCQHGFLRYTSTNNAVVTPNHTNRFYNGNTQLTILSNSNGVIEFNKPLTKIGNAAFQTCQNLKTIKFPNTLTDIGSLAFSSCTGFSGNITIPSSVTSIGQYAFFFNNYAYITVRNESTTPQSYSEIFYHPENMTLLVPASAVQTYRAANGWKSFKSINCIEHDYSQMSTDAKYAIKAVTCTTAGTYYYSCYCGLNENNASHTFTVAALGHNYTSETATDTYLKSAANCTADAVYYHKCSRCASKGSTTWTNTGSALGHSYGAGSWSWADDGHSATCSLTCGRTGCTTNTTGHTFSKSVTLGNGIASEQQVAPNCTTKGTTRYTATATAEGTQYSATKDVVDIAALGHGTTGYTPTYSWGGTYDAATCTFTLKCNKCNDNVVNNQTLTTSIVSDSHVDATCVDGNERWSATGSYSNTGDASYNGTAQTKNYAIPGGHHTFADDDLAQSVCTVCDHGFFRYTTSDNLPVTLYENKNWLITDADGNSFISNTNVDGKGVMEFNKPLETIGQWAFMNSKITGSITIPYTVKSIGVQAFVYCHGFTSVELTSVPQVGSGAFFEVTNNRTVVLSDKSYVYTGENPYFPAVTSVTYTRENIKNEWGTIVAPFKMGNGDDYDLYTLSEVSEDKLTLAKVSGTIEAGTPVIFRVKDTPAPMRLREEGDDEPLSITFKAATNAVNGQGTLAGSAAGGLQLIGTYQAKELTDDDYFISNNKFWSVADFPNATVKATPFRAYLHSTGASAKASSLSISIADGNATAIDTLNAITEGAAEYYDLSGKRILKLQKGINIVKMSNGKTIKVNIK